MAALKDPPLLHGVRHFIYDIPIGYLSLTLDVAKEAPFSPSDDDLVVCRSL